MGRYCVKEIDAERKPSEAYRFESTSLLVRWYVDDAFGRFRVDLSREEVLSKGRS